VIEIINLPELGSPDTGDVLKLMLTENTGRAMCDSGDFYGRNWQQNQGREFEPEPETTLTFHSDWIEVTHNIYHWLKERLTYSPEWQKRFDEFVVMKDAEQDEFGRTRDHHWLELMRMFPVYLQGLKQDVEIVSEIGETTTVSVPVNEVGGIYGEDEAECMNTYNHDSFLSQIIQFVYAEVNGQGLVLLQIHGGCDARGGYTAPKLFLCDADEFSIFDDAKAYIQCSNYQEYQDPDQEILPGMERQRVEHYWQADDAYNWYQQGAWNEKKLNDYEIVEWDEEGAPVPGTRNTDVIVVKDGTGYCPICGGTLEAFS
jgi:hypothetical protein